jgi:hypothetical protein
MAARAEPATPATIDEASMPPAHSRAAISGFVMIDMSLCCRSSGVEVAMNAIGPPAPLARSVVRIHASWASSMVCDRGAWAGVSWSMIRSLSSAGTMSFRVRQSGTRNGGSNGSW